MKVDERRIRFNFYDEVVAEKIKNAAIRKASSIVTKTLGYDVNWSKDGESFHIMKTTDGKAEKWGMVLLYDHIWYGMGYINDICFSGKRTISDHERDMFEALDAKIEEVNDVRCRASEVEWHIGTLLKVLIMVFLVLTAVIQSMVVSSCAAVMIIATAALYWVVWIRNNRRLNKVVNEFKEWAK